MPLLAPRLAAWETMRHSAGDRIEHHIQAGVAAHNDIMIVNAQHLCKQLPHFRQSIAQAVIAAVVSGGGVYI